MRTGPGSPALLRARTQALAQAGQHGSGACCGKPGRSSKQAARTAWPQPQQAKTGDLGCRHTGALPSRRCRAIGGIASTGTRACERSQLAHKRTCHRFPRLVPPRRRERGRLRGRPAPAAPGTPASAGLCRCSARPAGPAAVQRGRRAPRGQFRLGEQDPVLEVHAGGVDGGLGAGPMVDDRHDRLQDGRSGCRLEPALPSTSSTSPPLITTVGAIMLGRRRPAGCRWNPLRVQVLLAHHVVQVKARAGDYDRPSPPRWCRSTAAGAPRPRRSRRCGSWSRGEAARKRSRKPSWGEPLQEVGGALAWAAAIAPTTAASVAAPGPRPSSARAYPSACRRPTGGGW